MCQWTGPVLHSFQAPFRGHGLQSARCFCSTVSPSTAANSLHIPCEITSPGRLLRLDSTRILLSGRDPGPAMLRFATGWSSPLDAAEKYRGYATRNSWPYGPTQNVPTQPGSISSHPAHQAASSSRVAAPRAGSGGLVNSVEQLLHHIKHMQGFRDVWEVGATLFNTAQADQCAGWPTTLHMTRTAAACLSLRRWL